MTTTVEVAATHGCHIPVLAWECSQREDVPYAVTLAFLDQESGGGYNVFGHDGGSGYWYSGAGTVTAAKYAAYKAGRPAHGAQGVGPMQLTSPDYQDAADALGGCWMPVHNITEGLRILKGYHAQTGDWHEAARRYNAGGASQPPAGSQYADEVAQRITAWTALLAGATPPGGQVTGSKWGSRWGQQDYHGTGMKVTGGMAQALERLRILAGEAQAVTMYQGSFHKGVPGSAETHWGADVVDISDYNLQARAEAAAKIGLILYHRPFNWDGKRGIAHCHTILRPGPAEVQASLAQKGHLNYQAAQQILDWDQHLDGLADRRPYTAGPWYPVRSFVWHPDWTPDGAQQPGKPPSKHPLADKLQRSTGDTARILDEAIADAEAFLKAHPHLPAVQTALTQMKAARAQVPAWWDTAHAHNPA